ncbi:MAG: tetratricopeptide repeat protein, partial [Nitrososphaeria archaeon]|nr:tetratricopeptide repeat protein [Nitrososphaeria archaeon]
YGKGVALGNLKRHYEEIKCYDEVLKINPNDYRAWRDKGLTLAHLGRNEEAIKCFDEALRINPNSEIVQYNKRKALEKLEKQK